MNHECNGEQFATDQGESHYRCSYDGAVVVATKNGDPCPRCGRFVDATDRGVLQVVTQVKRFVTLPDGREAILSCTETKD